MATTLHSRHKKFVLSYLSNGLNARRAALDAGYSAKSAASYGPKLLLKLKIAAAIAAEQEKMADLAGIRIEHHIRELQRLRDAAVKAGAFNAAVSAETRLGDVLGFGPVTRSKVEQTNISVPELSPVARQQWVAGILADGGMKIVPAKDQAVETEAEAAEEEAAEAVEEEPVETGADHEAAEEARLPAKRADDEAAIEKFRKEQHGRARALDRPRSQPQPTIMPRNPWG